MAFGLAMFAMSAAADGLGVVESLLDLRYPLPQLRPADVATKAYLLFDVRSAQEYAVSRLAGAVRIAPERDAADFLRQYRAIMRGHVSVFYCTVGARSSRLAWAVVQLLDAHDSLAVYNLRGGILRWRQAGLPLVNDAGPTTWVHPYSATWARLAPSNAWLSTRVRNDTPVSPP